MSDESFPQLLPPVEFENGFILDIVRVGSDDYRIGSCKRLMLRGLDELPACNQDTRVDYTGSSAEFAEFPRHLRGRSSEMVVAFVSRELKTRPVRAD